MNDRPDTPPSLSADDPRISEWLDGRLPAAEATAIERAVRASPALTALAADLRAMKDAARVVAAVAPPADFADRVLATIASGGGQADPDRAVADEWQAIEAARLAEERAEAAADIAEAAHEPSPRRHWPWLALVGALAAGLLVTLILNRPLDEQREVALAEPKAAARLREPSRADLPGKEQVAARGRGLSPVPAAGAAPAALADGQPPADGVATLAARPETERLLVAQDEAAPMKDAEARVPMPEEPAPIEVVVWGAEGRAALNRRIEALGLVARPTQALGRQAARKTDPAADVLELVGRPEAIATLLAEVAGWEQSERAADKPGLDGIAAGKRVDAPAGEGRTVIRIIEEKRPPQAPAKP